MNRCKKIVFSFLLVVFGLAFTGCEYLSQFLNGTETEDEISIEQSGLAVNKYIYGEIDGTGFDFTLFSKSGKFVAEKNNRSATADSYDGYFVYNSSTKTVFLRLDGKKTFYKKASIDLSGTKGSTEAKRVSASFSASGKNEFTEAVETVSSLPAETTEDPINTDDPVNTGDPANTDDPVNTGDPANTDDPVNTDDPANTNDPETPDSLPWNKTASTYTGGVRNVNLVTPAKENGIIFNSTVMPREKPDYSSIDNAVKNITIDTASSIEDAAQTIVSSSGATTLKQKVRAIFTWIALNLEYDDAASSSKNAAGAFTTRKANCAGYSSLLSLMCKSEGIMADYVSGYDKRNQTPEDQKKTGTLGNHGWNLVHSDEGDFLLDVTWASGYTSLVYSAGRYTEKYIHEFNDQWFDVDPCYMITSHLPANASNQLLSTPVTRSEFITFPRIDAELEGLGIDGKELFEFIYSHLDTWIFEYNSILKNSRSDNVSVNIYKIPMSRHLINDTRYDLLIDADGTLCRDIRDSGTFAYLPDTTNLPVSISLASYYLVDSYDYQRDSADVWKAFQAENSSQSGIQGVKISFKSGMSGSIAADGTITVNGKQISFTEQVVVVPEGTVASITGNQPVAETPYIAPGACEYTFLTGDSAFPVGRNVKLSSFAMSKYPVTRELYKTVMEGVSGFEGLTDPNWSFLGRGFERDGVYDEKKFLAIYYYPEVGSDVEDEMRLPVCNLAYYDAVYFCNALTTLLMGEEECVYKITDIERREMWTEGIDSDVPESEIIDFVTDLKVPRENIRAMWIQPHSNYEHQTNFGNIKTAYVFADFTKKGFRLPTDAEWEYAARGASPESSSWTVRKTEGASFRGYDPNEIGICNMFNSIYGFGQNELVEDWITSNTEYFGRDIVSADGYVWNPCFVSAACTSVRENETDREMSASNGSYNDKTKIRLVRTLE